MSIAIVNVDVQKDFIDGSLGGMDAEGVARRQSVVKPIVDLCNEAKRRDPDTVVFSSADQHPADHSSFVSQMPEGFKHADDKDPRYRWPDHCVAGTPGAEIRPEIMEVTDQVVPKGLDRNVEEYSAAAPTTGLVETLDPTMPDGRSTVIVTGLCTDYCVRQTALDLVERFNVIVPMDTVCGVDVNPGDSERALAELRKAGVIVSPSWQHALDTAMRLDGPAQPAPSTARHSL